MIAASAQVIALVGQYTGPMRLPDLESLRCFEAAAIALNFRKAARAVALSPAAFGDRIRHLEDQLGSALFQRSTRHVTLTVAGERLLPRARAVLALAQQCLQGSGETPQPFELTVGTRFELGLSWLTAALGSLERARPERALHLRFGDSEELLAQVRQGGIDCAVSSIRLGTPGVRYELLHREDYALVASPALLSRVPLRGAADADYHTLIDSLPDFPLFRYFLDAQPPGQTWSFGSVRFLGAIGAVKARVLEEAGVAVLPRYFVASELKSRRLREPLPRAKLLADQFRIIWRAGHPREPEVRALAAELRERPLR
jgi:LysR family transcriptional regulator, glycine cleavage system transcriptional activator